MADITDEKPSIHDDAFQDITSDDVETSEAGPSHSTPLRDRKFYFEPVTFQVGNTIFKVPKSGFLVPGTIFEAMFALPMGEAEDGIEGSSDNHPIHLNGVEETKFRAFLTILYPSSDDATIPSESWYGILIGALDLATMWDFAALRKEIISKVSPIILDRNKQEVIYIAKRYRVADWLRATYKKLVDPSSELPITELMSSPYPMDWETMTKIYFIRETLLRGSIGNAYCGNCAKYYGPGYPDARYSCECRVLTFIDTHFQEEFQSMTDSLSDPFYPAVPTAFRNSHIEASGGKKTKKKKK